MQTHFKRAGTAIQRLAGKGFPQICSQKNGPLLTAHLPNGILLREGETKLKTTRRNWSGLTVSIKHQCRFSFPPINRREVTACVGVLIVLDVNLPYRKTHIDYNFFEAFQNFLSERTRPISIQITSLCG